MSDVKVNDAVLTVGGFHLPFALVVKHNHEYGARRDYAPIEYDDKGRELFVLPDGRKLTKQEAYRWFAGLPSYITGSSRYADMGRL